MMKSAVIVSISLFILLASAGNSVCAESLSASGITTAAESGKSDEAGTADRSAEAVPGEESITLLFMGDIMGHDSQIRSALQPDGVTYDYNSCFDYIRDYISAADIAIANLEVTLAGPPYTGFPMFSSPDALASACKDAGIDVLVTANNHCVDRGKTGLERTIRILDSLNIMHTGTFLSYSDKQKKSPLIIEKKSFRIALVSYTAETNEIPVPEPSFVNIIRKKQLLDDIARAKLAKPDALILFLHWGIEKQKAPGEGQLALADLCFKAGADIIIGSHPHVVQKSIWINRYGRGKFAAFSLGNFIANQKAPGTDGGQMIQLTLSRKDGIAAVSKANYILTWIYGPGTRLNRKFYILPCRDYEESPEFFAAPGYYKRMKEFISESGRLLDSQNKNVDEME